MRNQILAIAAVFAVAVGASNTACASDHKARHSRAHASTSHTTMYGELQNHARYAGVRGRETGSNVGGGFIDLGPLGITAACGAYTYRRRTCGQGYPVSAWSY